MRTYYFKFIFVVLFGLTGELWALAQVPGTPYLTTLPFSNSVHFDLEYTTCVRDIGPDGWLRRALTPDCAATRGGVMNPTDDDDEVIMFGEGLRRNISSLGIVSGATLKITIDAVAGNLDGIIVAGDHTFEVRIFSANPGHAGSLSQYGIGCTGGQLVLAGTNDTTTIQQFTNTVTLTQNANWITVSNCDTNGEGGNIIDDLILNW